VQLNPVECSALPDFLQKKQPQGYIKTRRQYRATPHPHLSFHPAYQLTSSSHLQLSPQELREVVTAFNDTNEPKAVQATGLHLAGEKYFVIKADEKSLYGKKVRIINPVPRILRKNVSWDEGRVMNIKG
jgi:Profilin